MLESLVHQTWDLSLSWGPGISSPHLRPGSGHFWQVLVNRKMSDEQLSRIRRTKTARAALSSDNQYLNNLSLAIYKWHSTCKSLNFCFYPNIIQKITHMIKIKYIKIVYKYIQNIMSQENVGGNIMMIFELKINIYTSIFTSLCTYMLEYLFLLLSFLYKVTFPTFIK